MGVVSNCDYIILRDGKEHIRASLNLGISAVTGDCVPYYTIYFLCVLLELRLAEERDVVCQPNRMVISRMRSILIRPPFRLAFYYIFRPSIQYGVRGSRLIHHIGGNVVSFNLVIASCEIRLTRPGGGGGGRKRRVRWGESCKEAAWRRGGMPIRFQFLDRCDSSAMHPRVIAVSLKTASAAAVDILAFSVCFH